MGVLKGKQVGIQFARALMLRKLEQDNGGQDRDGLRWAIG